MNLHQTIKDPESFDVLRRSDARFEQIELLREVANLDHLSYCRLAQYYFYRERLDEAEAALLQAGHRGDSWLARALGLMRLEVTGDASGLREAAAQFKPSGATALLDFEAFGLGFEVCAFHYGFNEQNSVRATAYLHRAEGIALGLGLTYRLGVIRSKLAFLAAQEGVELPATPLAPSGAIRADANERRARYLGLLAVYNVYEITQLALAGIFNQVEAKFARAVTDYERVLEGKHSPYLLADQVSALEPGDAQLGFFQALVMLQLFSLIGEADGRLSLNRVQRLLAGAVEDLKPFEPSASFAAAHYPLGLHLAASLEPKFAPYLSEAAVLKCGAIRNDGLWRGGKKLVTVPRAVREALILDGATASSQHFQDAASGPSANRQNRARFNQALKQADVRRSEFADVGRLWRGYRLLGEVLRREVCVRRAENLAAETPLIAKLGNVFAGV